MRLKKMARWPPSTAGEKERGQRGEAEEPGGRLRGRDGTDGLTDEDGLADAVGQGAGAQQQLEGGPDAPRPGRQPPRQVLQVLRHGRAAPRLPPGRTPEAASAKAVPAGNRSAAGTASPGAALRRGRAALRKWVRPEADNGRAAGAILGGRGGGPRRRWGGGGASGDVCPVRR